MSNRQVTMHVPDNMGFLRQMKLSKYFRGIPDPAFAMYVVGDPEPVDDGFTYQVKLLILQTLLNYGRKKQAVRYQLDQIVGKKKKR